MFWGFLSIVVYQGTASEAAEKFAYFHGSFSPWSFFSG
jgi:hypothetical protein